MAFEARNLRVQLPCLHVTLVDCTPAQTFLCQFPTRLCRYDTIPHCIDTPIVQCIAGTNPTEIITLLTPNCGTTKIAQVPVHVDVEDLEVLHAHLEEQLKEIEIAQEAVAAQQKGKRK
jgi:hypothetical protein